MTPTITVYTSEACMPCHATLRHLIRGGASFTEASAHQHADHLAAHGFTSTPVVEVALPDGTDRWAGYRPERLDAAIAAQAAA